MQLRKNKKYTRKGIPSVLSPERLDAFAPLPLRYSLNATFSGVPSAHGPCVPHVSPDLFGYADIISLFLQKSRPYDKKVQKLNEKSVFFCAPRLRVDVFMSETVVF